MLTFMHTYTEESWEGLDRKGLFRQGDGLKLMSKVYSPKGRDFNSMLAKNAPLSRLLEELRCPFYIDRLQGGVGLPHWYPYDPVIVHRLISLLGDDFWGWQIHEWASNYNSDISRIKELYKKLGAADPTPEQRFEIWQSVRAGREKLFLEALTQEEWTGRREPADLAMFLDDINWLYGMRASMTGSRLVPADSYFMAPRLELAGGAKILLPEVGWQIPNARVQMAYTRGMARAAGVPWGIYYECWCYNHAAGGLTIPLSLRKGQDEWCEDLVKSYTATGRSPEQLEQGGTSRNLQQRLWRYAYFSGASVIGEEYGVCNTFRDYEDFDLGPYGQTKKEFLDFASRFEDLGQPYTPIAVVLPKDLPVLQVNLPENYLNYPASDRSGGPDPAAWQMIRQILPELFGTAGTGNNAHVLTPGGLPDVFDIIHADDEKALSRYDYLIDLTGGSVFPPENHVITPEEADTILTDLLPLRIGGGVHTAYNKKGSGWLVFAANNNGVSCDNYEGDRIDPAAAVTAEIRYRDPASCVRVLDGTGGICREDGRDTVCLGGGEWLLMALDN